MYYGYVYKVTNLLNGKCYVGQHKYSDYPNIDPSYHGGGVIIKQAIKKYGLENFKEEILEWCKTKEEINKRERELTFIHKADKSSGGYVLLAGDGREKEISEELLNRYRSKEWCEAISKRMKGNSNGKGAKRSEEFKQACSERMQGNQRAKGLKGYKRSEREKKNMSERMKKQVKSGAYKKFLYAQKGRHTGECWYTDGKTNVRAKECPEGFVKGMTATYGKTSTGTHWYNNGITETMATECPKGYTLGRLASVFHRTEEYAVK